METETVEITCAGCGETLVSENPENEGWVEIDGVWYCEICA